MGLFLKGPFFPNTPVVIEDEDGERTNHDSMILQMEFSSEIIRMLLKTASTLYIITVKNYMFECYS